MTKSIDGLMQDGQSEKAPASSSWGKIIEKTSEKTGDYFINIAKQQLTNILFESKKIKETQSRLQLVMERCYLQKSTISTISDWYSERPFWQKLAMSTIIIGVAVMAGLFVHAAMTALFAAVAIGFCVTAHLKNMQPAPLSAMKNYVKIWSVSKQHSACALSRCVSLKISSNLHF